MKPSDLICLKLFPTFHITYTFIIQPPVEQNEQPISFRRTGNNRIFYNEILWIFRSVLIELVLDPSHIGIYRGVCQGKQDRSVRQKISAPCSSFQWYVYLLKLGCGSHPIIPLRIMSISSLPEAFICSITVSLFMMLTGYSNSIIYIRYKLPKLMNTSMHQRRIILICRSKPA